MRFYRNNDGTGFTGHICWAWDDIKYGRLSFKEPIAPSIENAYRLFGTCSALRISPKRMSSFGMLDPLYVFLYGKPLNQFDLSELVQDDPPKWTPSMVASMDWDSFCLSFYTFLSSKSDFNSYIWEALESILCTLRANSVLLISLLAKNVYNSASSTSEFWDTIYNGLCIKVSSQLGYNGCHISYCDLQYMKGFLPDSYYQPLEKKCCDYFDRIARERIEAACEKKYSIREMVNFDIEELFFYEDYFSLASANKETKQYVYDSVFALLQTKGDKVLASNNFIGADDVYSTALKYALSGSNKELIMRKRSNIAIQVNHARQEKEKADYLARQEAECARQEAERAREKRAKEEARRDKMVNICAYVALGFFILSVLAAILFGILWSVGVFTPSKILFFVAAGIVVILLLVYWLISLI